MSQCNRLRVTLNVNRKVSVDQRGQAISEALLVLGIFFILMIGIQTSMSIQFTALNLLLGSVKKVFRVHLGDLIHTEYGNSQYSKIKGMEKFSPSKNNYLSSRDGHSLFEELNMTQPGLISAHSSSIYRAPNLIQISRQSFIETGTGSAFSDQAVQTRIGTSVSLWSDVFKRSSNVMDSVHTLTSKVDKAWSRPQISRDFIQPWAGVVPEHSLLQGHLWRN